MVPILSLLQCVNRYEDVNMAHMQCHQRTHQIETSSANFVNHHSNDIELSRSIAQLVSITSLLSMKIKVNLAHMQHNPTSGSPPDFHFLFPWFFPDFPLILTGNFPDVFCIYHWKLHYQLYMNHILGDKCFSKYLKHCINAVLSFWYSCS